MRLRTISFVLALGALGGEAGADLVPVGMRSVRHLCEISLDRVATVPLRRATAVEGDTFDAIAARALHDAGRGAEVAALNGGFFRGRPRPGATVRVPAHAEAGGSDGPSRRWFLLAHVELGFLPGFDVVPLESGARTSLRDAQPMLVLAVREDVFPRFAPELVDRGGTRESLRTLLEEWRGEPGFARSEREIVGDARTSRDSRVRTRVDRWEVVGIEGDEVRLERIDERRYGEDGRRVDPPPVRPLLLLGAAALVGLVLVRRSRGRGGDAEA
ncbi:MAG: hypothetical protein ACF8XB_01270 [Planctomycetota bacterium JB042]